MTLSRANDYDPSARMGSDSDFEKAEELVERIARRIHRELELSCELEDLRGWGHQGWLEAKQRFDPDRGARLSTFAYYRVRGAIIDGVRKQGWLSRRAYAKVRALEAADDIAEQYGAATASSPAASVSARAVDLETALGQISAAYILASLESDAADHETPETRLDSAEEQATVRARLAELPDKERALLTAIYFDGLTIEQGGSRIGLSKSWASRLHAKALDRLRKGLAAKGVE